MTFAKIKYWARLLSVGLGVLFTSHALACPPCKEILSLEETIKQAEVIAIAEHAGHVVHNKRPDIFKTGETKVKLKLLHILKGDLQPATVIVLAYSGPCHGVDLSEHETALVLLKKTPDGEYDAINHGCSFRQARVRDGLIEINNSSMTLEVFSRQYLQ